VRTFFPDLKRNLPVSDLPSHPAPCRPRYSWMETMRTAILSANLLAVHCKNYQKQRFTECMNCTVDQASHSRHETGRRSRIYQIGPAKIKFQREENLRPPDLWFLRSSIVTSSTTNSPAKHHDLRTTFSPTPLKNACKNNKRTLPTSQKKNPRKSRKIPHPNRE
jgi:hypothetical protein